MYKTTFYKIIFVILASETVFITIRDKCKIVAADWPTKRNEIMSPWSRMLKHLREVRLQWPIFLQKKKKRKYMTEIPPSGPICQKLFVFFISRLYKNKLKSKKQKQNKIKNSRGHEWTFFSYFKILKYNFSKNSKKVDLSS